jgi:predicted Rossmann fold flavoprotein
MKKVKKIAVIGGGAAGFFAALSAKYHHPEVAVSIFEKTSKVLSKVKVSGGGRCNVTNATTDIPTLCKAYPRGGKQLRNLFYRFNTTDTQAWFERRGVALKTEADGRVFPVSNESQSIIDCLLNEAENLGIGIVYQAAVANLKKIDDSWSLSFLKEEKELQFDIVIIATGGSPKLEGFRWLETLEHTVVPPLPSLFTFNMPKDPITELMGVTVDHAKVKIKDQNIETDGPLLITHWGMSGPAILKASAFGAPALAECQYNFEIQVNWLGERNTESLFNQLHSCAIEHPQKAVSKQKAFPLPQRLWQYLVKKKEIPADMKWIDLGKKKGRQLVELLANDTYVISGKTTFKEEFVTCGGIALNSVDLKTMQSKSQKGLYFAGEVLNIDAITGGYNFQAAWSTGFIAGQLNENKT